MNRIYRLIVNHALGCLQVASEHARRGKGSGETARRGCVGGTSKGAYPQEKVLLGQILQALRPVLPVIVLGMGILAPGVASAGAVSTISGSTANYTVTGNTISQVSITSAGTVSGLFTVSGTGTISGSSVGILNGGSIASLSNSGAIRGSANGVANIETIDTLSNLTGGTIIGSVAGIDTSDTISTLNNSALISGSFSGISNDDIVGSLNNSAGTIIGSVFGISNDGTIGSLNNSAEIIGGITNYGSSSGISSNSINDLSNRGVIIGGIGNGGTIGSLSNLTGGIINGGIGNGGSIGTLSNSGDISSTIGISNVSSNSEAVIGTLSNSGDISGSIGVYNSGSIGTLNDSGVISSSIAGISNYGTIGSLNNLTDGNISGDSGISNSGSIGVLSNSGNVSGTIGNSSNYGSYGINNGGTIGSLSNSGNITGTGNGAGIDNEDGSIDDLSNLMDGTISGGSYGIENYGSIDILNNSGNITSNHYGISNGGSIGMLSNLAGGVINGGGSGISNGGSIGTLSNSGILGGGSYGIENYDSGTIGRLINSMDIAGAGIGISNGGSIGSLSNSGNITSNHYGISNGGSIGVLSNMADGTISGNAYGIYNYGSIGSLSNSGNISDIQNTGVIGSIGSNTGIYLEGGGTTLVNTGTIIGATNAIDVAGSNPSTLIFSTGSDIQGAINAGTTTSEIILEGDPTLTSAAPIVAPDSTLTITKTGNWAVNDNWTIGTVTNNGVLAVGSPGGSENVSNSSQVDPFGGTLTVGSPSDSGQVSILLPGTLNLTGNYVQDVGGTLSMAITNSDSIAGTDYSQLNVTGTANLAGTLEIVPNGSASGYTVGETYDLIQATGGITGTFGTLTGLQELSSYVTGTMSYSAHQADLVLTPVPTQAALPLPVQYQQLSNMRLFSSGRTVATSSYASNRSLLTAVNTLMDGAGQVNHHFTDSRIGSWVKGFGGFGRTNGASVENYGGITGYGTAINRHLVLGAAFAGIGTGASTSQQVVNDKAFGGFGYAIDTHGHLRLSAMVLAGYIQQNSTRYLSVTENSPAFEEATGSTDGWYMGAGVQAQYLVPLGSSYLMPYGRMDYLHTQMNGYAEQGANQLVNLNITYGGIRTNVAAFSGGLRLGHDFRADDVTIIPWVSVGGTGYAGTLQVAQSETVGLLSATEIGQVTPSVALNTDAGLTFTGRHSPWSMKLAYQGEFAGDTHFNTFDCLANYRW